MDRLQHCIMSDSGYLKPDTLCYVHGYDPFARGKVVEVIGPYMCTDCDRTFRALPTH